MIKKTMIRTQHYLRPDQINWLKNQNEDQSTTLRRLIDAEIECQNKSKKS